MKEEYILAIDQGTTNTKALLVGRCGKPMFRASAPVHVSSPMPDWVEQDPMEIWNSVRSVIEEILAQIPSGTLAGVAISNQRETVVVWERATGKPLAPAIVWQCRRSTEVCSALRTAGQESLLRSRTGLAIDPLFSGSKVCWLLDHVPGLRKRAEEGEVCCGTVDSWVIWNLTGGKTHACDLSNASRTQLLNIHTCDWDETLLTLFRVPRCVLPNLSPSSSVLGKTVSIGSLPAGIPIASAIGDSHAALFGHASSQPGTTKATYGTGSSLMTLVATPNQETTRLASTIAWSFPGKTQYALEGNITMTGAAVQWVGEFLRLHDPVPDAVGLAETVGDSGGVYLVPAMVGLGAPHWDSSVRGAILGLSRTSSMAHLANAAVEAIAFQVRDVFEAMEEDAGCKLPALYADGGASQNNRLMQFQADILGRPVIRSSSPELSAMGAAWLAGIAMGWWPTIDSLTKLAGESETFQPRMDDQERKRRYAGWLEAVAQVRYRSTATS